MDKSTRQLLQELETLRQENEALRSAASLHRQNEEALKASEKRYRTIVEHAPEAIVVLDWDAGHFVDVNANAVDLFQMEREALFQVGPVALSPPEQPNGRPSSEAAKTYLLQALNGETPVFEWMHRDSKGRDIPCEIRLVRIPDVSRNLVRGSITDITERKRAEQIQQVLLARLNAIVEATDELLSCQDLDSLYRRAVELARTRLGLERCSLYLLEKEAAVFRGTYGTDDRGEMIDEHLMTFPQTEYWDRQFKPHRSGERAWMAIEQSQTYWDGEKVVFVGEGWIVHTPIEAHNTQIGFFFNDCAISGKPLEEAQQETLAVYASLLGQIIERKRLQEQLLQSQKMEGIGRLAGGIAHDFNNLLTAILGYTELAEEQLPPEDAAHACLTNVRKAALRAADLTAQLLAFARKQIIAPQVIDLNTLVVEMHGLLERLIGEDVELVTLPGANLWYVKIDPGQFEQILVNLVVNARDAMPKGGKMTIETANVCLEEDYRLLHTEVVPGEYVMLAVSDTGVGMDADTRKSIFEPFFTTKEQGKGTGLGLATCHGIVKQHGGHIWAYSELGQGTTIKIYLPRVEEPASVPTAIPVLSSPRGWETILLVEDEPMVRSIAESALLAQGYRVLAAGTGSEALALAQEYAQTIHLLMTDVVMPQMSGKQLAERLLVLRPAMKVLYASGYTDNTIVHHGVLDAGVAFLQKPYSPNTLARKVREILDDCR